MTSSTTTAILIAAAEQLDRGGSVSLDSVARAVGLTKAGVIHHFATKEKLMLALVDAVIDRWETELRGRLAAPVSAASPAQRMAAYLDWSLSGEFGEADLVTMSDPRLRRSLTSRWSERMTPWLAIPSDVEPESRARLIAVRLLADGGWLADAAGFYPPTPDERARIRALGHRLLEESA